MDSNHGTWITVSEIRCSLLLYGVRNLKKYSAQLEYASILQPSTNSQIGTGRLSDFCATGAGNLFLLDCVFFYVFNKVFTITN